MAISALQKLNEALTTLHRLIFTKEEISITKKDKAISFNKNREGDKMERGDMKEELSVVGPPDPI